LAAVLIVAFVSDRNLGRIVLPIFGLAWILYGTLWLRDQFITIARAGMNFLRHGSWLSGLIVNQQLAGASVPAWVLAARYLWIPLVFLLALLWVVQNYLQRGQAKILMSRPFVLSDEGFLILLLVVPPLASIAMLPATLYGLLFERFLIFSSLPAAYFSARFLQAKRLQARLVTSFLVAWVGMFFFVNQPFLYSRITHTWDSAAARFQSEKDISAAAPVYALVTRKLYDRKYGSPISQYEPLTLPDIVARYRKSPIYFPQSLDVVGYWLRFRVQDLATSSMPGLSLMYENGHGVVVFLSDGTNSQ
jgi:hypothetical protein